MVSTKSKKEELEDHRQKLATEICDLNHDYNRITHSMQTLRQKLREVKNQIKTLQDNEPKVTEHAMLRLIERGFDIDVDEMKEGLIDKVRDHITDGTCTVPINDNLVAVIKDRVIVTIQDK